MTTDISSAEIPMSGAEPASEPSTDIKPTDVPSADAPEQPENPEQPKAEPSEADKIKAAMQKRIDRLTKRDAERERQLREFQVKQPAAPNALKEPKEEDYKTYEEFVEARGRYKAEVEYQQKQAKEAQERQAAEQTKQIEAKRKDFEVKEVELRKIHPDYDEAVAVMNEFVAQADPRSIGTAVFRDVLMDSDNMPALVYHLGKNPDLVESLFTMSPLQIAKTLIKTEMSLADAPKQTPQKPIPNPPNAISGKSNPSGKPLWELDGDDYRKARFGK